MNFSITPKLPSFPHTFSTLLQNPNQKTSNPRDLSSSPGRVLQLGVLPLCRMQACLRQRAYHALLTGKQHTMPCYGLPCELKSDKVKDDPLLATDIDELRKTQNQNAMTDVRDVTEFEE